jgi:hypothetical protein
MILSIKKTLMTLVFSSLAICPLQAENSETNIEKVRNEVAIMLNILQASLKQQRSDKNLRLRAGSVFYLADQGVVFQIDSGRHGGHFLGFDLGGLSGLINNFPIAPNSPNPKGRHIEINIDDNEIERMVMDFVEHGDHYDDDLSDKMRDLSEKQREFSWEKREYERSRRDLEFEKRNADPARRKEIDNRLAGLNKDVAKLESKTAGLEKYRNELEAERNQEMANRQAVKKKLYSESLALFEDTIGEMLCNYGAGLRALSDDENISFVLSDFVDAGDDSVIGTHDKVYVFKHKDIKACVMGKSDKNELLTTAKTYLF